MQRDRLLLAAAGAGILLTQHVAVREIGSTFFSTELVLLGATAVILAGPSVAYTIAHRISPRLLIAWGCASLAAHLALPVGLRAAVGAMAARGFEGLALGVTAALAVLLLSAFHAVFLPRLAREQPLSRLYAAELSGALAALAFIAASPSHRITLAAYWGSAVLVLHLGLRSTLGGSAGTSPAAPPTPWSTLGGSTGTSPAAPPNPQRRAISLAAGLAATAAIASYPPLDRWAAAVYFAGYHGQQQPRLIETAYSAYQRIDVVDDARGRRALYLDGVPFHRSGPFDPFNTFLAAIPGALRADAAGGAGAALVIGSGSFSSAGHLHRLGYEVTVVELDAAVARIGFARFGATHRLSPGDVRVEIEDGRRYLARAERSFDLIALDVPAPYHVRTALLHTPRFYRLVASRLRPRGVVALSLCGPAFGDTARAIAAAAAEVFPSVIAVEPGSAGIALLYAGAPLPFSADAVLAALAQDPRGGLVFGDPEVRAATAGAPPLSEDRLAPVLVLARAQLEDSLRGR
jgi:spermidine synthase